jgi:hypothetical protein
MFRSEVLAEIITAKIKNDSSPASMLRSEREGVTITDLWLRTKKADPRTSHSTVWRLLKVLVECGMAHREISPAGILRYAPVKTECMIAWRAKAAAPPSPRKGASMAL